MKTLRLVWSYIVWHYSRAFADIWRNCLNLLWFLFYFFSVGLLLRTFFAPWKRMDIDPTKKEEMSDTFGRLIVNMLMRIVGVIMRGIMIIIGLCALVVILIGEVLFVCLWIILPLLIIAFFVKGLTLIFP